MPNSQNVRFAGESPNAASDEHPFGEQLAQLIASRLEQGGWTIGPLENWRDAGWHFDCGRNGAELEVILAALDRPTEWMLQIAPLRGGGLLSLFGRRASATPQDCLALARAVHAVLVALGYLELRWRWDGMPEAGKATPEPLEWGAGKA